MIEINIVNAITIGLIAMIFAWVWDYAVSMLKSSGVISA